MLAKNEEIVTAHVAKRIRTRRLEVGMTQQQAAGLLGISFQQLQKYEHGANRITAGRLFQLAEALDTNIAYFFDGCDSDAAPRREPDKGHISTTESLRLVRQFNAIPSDSLKRSVLNLMRSLEGVDTSPKPEDGGD